MKGHLVYFIHVLVGHHGGFKVLKYALEMPLWIPFAGAFISLLDPAPVFIPLIHARPFISNQHKCIQFRQHRILMNARIFTRKRKYLVIQLACTSSSNWSSMYSSRGYGCNNGIYFFINLFT